jgi:hypothetical protein
MRWTTLAAPPIAWTRDVPRSRRRVPPVRPSDSLSAAPCQVAERRPPPPAVLPDDASAPLRPRHVDRI